MCVERSGSVDSMADGGRCRINLRLLPVKLTYFLELGAVASLFPYLNVYMREIGLTYSEMSIIYGTSPFVTAILRTLVGIMADKLQRHRLILLVCCVLSGICHGLLLITPRSEAPMRNYAVCERPVALTCGPDGVAAVGMCAENHVCVNGGNCTDASLSLVGLSGCRVGCVTATDLCLRQTSDMLSVDSCAGNYTEALGNGQTVVFQNVDLQSSSVQYGGRQEPNCSQLDISSLTYGDKNQSHTTLSCSDNTQLDSCTITCEKSSPESALCALPDPTYTPEPYKTTFWYFFLLFLFGQIFYMPVFSLIDAMVYAYLGDESGKWGVQRLWGTVGFAVFAIIAGLIMDLFADLDLGHSSKDFTFCFVGFSALSIAGGLMVLCYRITKDIVAASMIVNIGALLRRFDVIVLLLCTFIYGAYTGVIETFLFVRLDELGASKLLMGLCMVINCLPEIVVLLFAGDIIKRLGAFFCLCIVFLSYAGRLIAYAFIANPWVFLVIEPLHSVTFGLMYATVSGYANEITPSGMHGTIQSIIGALYFGFGKGVGSLTSGQLYGRFGPRATFLGFGLSSLVFLALYCLAYYLVIRKNDQEREKPKDIDTKEVEMKMLPSPDDAKKPSDEEEAMKPNNKDAGKPEQDDLVPTRNSLEPQLA